MIGRLVSHYRVIEELGRGGMGVVYKAEDIKLERIVALKFLPPELTRDPQAKERFVQEARAAAALNHPNICTVHEIDEVDGRSFIAMEYIDGQTLRDKIKSGPLEIAEAVNITIQVAEGLREAHEKGITHRDIKTANVMLTDTDQAKIMDFGLAKLAGQVGLTKTSTTVGTVAYMSPEQARGETVDHRTDIWSLGVVLHEMLTGQLPFRGEYEQAVIYSILNEDPEPVTALRTGVPLELERCVSKATAKNPDERYQHIGDMLADLRTLRKQLETGKTEQRPAKKHLEKRKHLFLPAGIAVLVALAILIGIHFFLPREGRETIDSIAVLPLRNLSGDPDRQFFADGMTEALITELSKIEALRVISRTSVMRYKHTDKSLPEIANELNVDALVEGSALRVGETVRITVQLIQAEPEQHLWADKYDRDYRDILVLQSEVAQAIAHEIRIAVTPEEETRLISATAANPDAYESYLKGRFFVNRWAAKDVERGIGHFEQAIDKDPNYALAYAGLAQGHMYLVWQGWIPPKEGWPRVEAEARKALEIDETLGEAHAILAEMEMSFQWNWKQAEKRYKRAIHFNPGYANARSWYAWYLSAMGRHDEAIAEMERALRLDPLSIIINTSAAWIFMHARQYDNMIGQLQEVFNLDPNAATAQYALAEAYMYKMIYEVAINQFQKAIALNGGFAARSGLACAYALSGKIDEAAALLEQILEQSRHEYVPAYNIARIYAALDDGDQAIQWLEKMYEERSSNMVTINVNPAFDNLHSDPRFTALMRKVGLTP